MAAHLAKAFSRMDTQRRRVFDTPDRIVREHREMVMEELGADPRTPWKYTDLHKRVNWGMMRSMQRCYIQDCAILILMEKGLYREAHAQVVQNSCADHVRAEDEVLRRSRDVPKANLSDGEGGKGNKGEGKGDAAAPKAGALSKKEKAKLKAAAQQQGAEPY